MMKDSIGVCVMRSVCAWLLIRASRLRCRASRQGHGVRRAPPQISTDGLTDRSACSSTGWKPIRHRLTPPNEAEESPLNCRRQEFGMRRLVWKFLSDQSGATAIEYCLIAAGLSIVIVVAVNGIGTTLNGKYASVNNSIK
jgi:pilus assembly protein Flp/PilA